MSRTGGPKARKLAVNGTAPTALYGACVVGVPDGPLLNLRRTQAACTAPRAKGRSLDVALYLAEPECLPTDWRGQAGEPGSAATARLACDFIAGMTDRFAAEEHNQLFDVYSNI